jgi:hypothetical protein
MAEKSVKKTGGCALPVTEHAKREVALGAKSE